ncbi:hypothetical protein ADL06_19320 [Streptomyces sp. NRRL F-6491]|nr:hypothetical protein ADL06_19320 [Streptomyces sp. NRRL F-6491]KOX37044.1 hypothetical protein ADL08_30610 [Streptomyces sp. NRRL F-6492]
MGGGLGVHGRVFSVVGRVMGVIRAVVLSAYGSRCARAWWTASATRRGSTRIVRQVAGQVVVGVPVGLVGAVGGEQQQPRPGRAAHVHDRRVPPTLFGLLVVPGPAEAGGDQVAVPAAAPDTAGVVILGEQPQRPTESVERDPLSPSRRKRRKWARASPDQATGNRPPGACTATTATAEDGP